MADYYSHCGWLPFGWSRTKAENVGVCGPNTKLKDGQCQLAENVGECGAGTAAVDNKCVIQFGTPIVVDEPYVCGLSGHFSGTAVDMQLYLENHNEIPSGFEVSIGGFDCTQATRDNNRCARFPSAC